MTAPTPTACIPMDSELLARIEEAFTEPFVADAQALDLEEWCEHSRTDLLDCLPLGPMAWTATTSSYWSDYILDSMSEADADRTYEIYDTLDEEELTEERTEALIDEAFAIESAYEPKPSTHADCWLPRHGCHYFLRTQGALALTLFPDRQWFGVSNDKHTFVVDEDGQVFDLLLHDSFSTSYHYTDRDAEALPLPCRTT